MTTTTFLAPHAWLHDGLSPYWAKNVCLKVDQHGIIQKITTKTVPDAAIPLAGPVLPGIANVHSHAFQRIMSGLAEIAGPLQDNFWTWRTLMYDVANRLTPEDIAAIATHLYIEFLKGGYTTVCEFHYLHHDQSGTAYSNPAELALQIISAAETAGIALTLLPVLYMTSGFGSKPPQASQRRFISTADHVLTLKEQLQKHQPNLPGYRIGIAPHSLRAVPPDALQTLISQAIATDPTCPIHLHIAEQEEEVERCLAWSGDRPVSWLLKHFSVNAYWSLIHATHVDTAETESLALSRATVGLCPTTEANLGDGIFPAKAYRNFQGRLAVGSDNQIALSPIVELGWLEYGQRLQLRQRNIFATTPGTSTGSALYLAAAEGGTQASGQKTGRLAPGYRADFVVLDPLEPTLLGREGDAWLDSLILGNIGKTPPIRDVFVGGKQQIFAGQHYHQEEAKTNFQKTLLRLREAC